MATHVFMIEDGKLFLSLVGDGDSSDWLAPTGKEVDEVVAADYTTGGGDFSCNVTRGVDPDAVDDDGDDPGHVLLSRGDHPGPGVTAYSLDVTGLQDVNVVNGISMFLFENDTKHAYFMLGLDGDDPPAPSAGCRWWPGRSAATPAPTSSSPSACRATPSRRSCSATPPSARPCPP